MKIISMEQKLKEKKNKLEPLCPKCGTEMDFEGNETFDRKEISSFRYIWKCFFGDLTTGNGWFKCPICKQEYFVEDYANKKSERKDI